MKKIYLDNASTTAPDANVLDVVYKTMKDHYANQASLHSMGQSADAVLENAREIAAEYLHAHPSEIFFTPSGTYSDNLAMLGCARANRKRGQHIITTQIEHHAVLESCKQLESEGFEVTYLPVDPEGLLNIRSLKEAIRPDTILISVMHVNNEIGTMQPIKEIGEIARKKKIIFHTDAVQSFGKMPIDVGEMNIDLMSVSAHKIHGPKGAALLYIRRGIKLHRILYGGNQERKIVPGTLNVPAVAGFAQAINNCSYQEAQQQGYQLMKSMRDDCLHQIQSQIPTVLINGSMEYRIAENLNLFFPDVDTDAFLYALDLAGICVSAGSACTAGSVEPSHVIRAIGRDQGGASIRISLSKYTTHNEIQTAADKIIETYSRLYQKKES